MYCVKCGSLISEGEQFCKECGQPMTAESQIALPMNTQNGSAKKKMPVGMIVLACVLAAVIVIGSAASITFGIVRGGESGQVKVEKTAVVQEEIAPIETTGEAEIEKVEETVSKGMPQSEKEFKASCQYYTYEQLARNPKDYIGKPVVLVGQVIQVMENDDEVQMRVNMTEEDLYWQDTVYVTYIRKSANESRILEDDVITLWGVSDDTITYDTVLNSTVTVPYIEAAYIEQGNQYESTHPSNTSNAMQNNENAGNYIMPYSGTYYLSDEDVRCLSKEDLRLARNEIYARHGRMFNLEEIQDYFDKQSWYVPTIAADDFNESMLSEVEKYNANFIKNYEEQLN